MDWNNYDPTPETIKEFGIVHIPLERFETIRMRVIELEEVKAKDICSLCWSFEKR